MTASGSKQHSDASSAEQTLTKAGLRFVTRMVFFSFYKIIVIPHHRYSAQHDSWLGSLKREMAAIFRASAMVG
jgi:hypothetical protein